MPPRQLDAEILPQLDEVIYRAREREPGDRYSTANAMAGDLEHPEQAAIPDRAELRDWKRRRRPAAGGAQSLHSALRAPGQAQGERPTPHRKNGG